MSTRQRRRNRRIAMVLAGLGSVAGAQRAAAHHSFSAEFDANKPFKMTGQVTKIEWMNPHTFFYVDVRDEKTGKIANWAMEMGSPNALTRAGWSRTTLKAGDIVTVEGSLAKDGSYTGNARAVVLAATGKRLVAASSQGTEERR
jgi:hypothetical protein